MRRPVIARSTLFVIIMLCYGAAAQAQTTRYVDNLRNCSGLAPCHASIQQAVDAASAGDTISVFPGVYHEAVVIDGKNSLTLQARDYTEKPVISASGRSAAVSVANAANLRVAFLILESEQGAGYSSGGMVAGNATIEGNEVHAPFGISVFACAGAMIRSNRVDHGDITVSNGSGSCAVERNTVVGGSIRYSGLGCCANGNSVRSNALSGGGIFLSSDNASQNVVSGNVIADGSIGLSGRNALNNLVRSNTVRRGSIGVAASTLAGNILEMNFVSDGGADGIYLRATFSPSTNGNNIVRGNTSAGSTCDIDDNADSAKNQWHGNRFVTGCGAANG